MISCVRVSEKTLITKKRKKPNTTGLLVKVKIQFLALIYSADVFKIIKIELSS